jgi:hypothetical protein
MLRMFDSGERQPVIVPAAENGGEVVQRLLGVGRAL